jgi:hypothetical protein
MIEAPGLYDDISEEAYHADPCKVPSLSSSVCKLIVGRSPRHAWQAHPRLNRGMLDVVETPTKTMDIGTATHKLILGKGRVIKELPFDDYRKDVAKKARDDARAAGMVPILSDDMARVRILAEAFRDQLPGTELADVFDDGDAEVTLVWQDLEDAWCRARVDWMPKATRNGGHVTIVDVKTTGGSGAPEDWPRTAFDMGYDISDAFYKRGVKELIPGVRSVTMKFAVLEQEAPNGLTIHEFKGQAFAEAEALVDLGVGLWSECLEKNKWPGYSAETSYIDPPKWRTERGLIRKIAMQRHIERMHAPLEKDGPHA